MTPRDDSQSPQSISFGLLPKASGPRGLDNVKESDNVAVDESCAAFFRRNGLDVRTRDICDQYARRQFPNSKLRPVEPQGYCSYTLSIGENKLLQFRPTRFKQGSLVSTEARLVFGDLVPAVTDLEVIHGIPAVPGGSEESSHLHVFLLDRVPGIPLAAFREKVRGAPANRVKASRRRLVEDIAGVFATGLKSSRSGLTESPFWRNGQQHNRIKGMGYVWRTLSWRLPLLKSLPGEPVSRHISQIQQRLVNIEKLPWCLTHGDMVPANIMVDPESGRLTGLIDWAEGEWLPFGIGLYGLEELLGEETPAQGFCYYDEHNDLRRLFWEKLMENAQFEKLRLRDVALARKFGILLWRGLAFEDGRIDRAVEAGRDDADIAKLDAFLQVDDGLGEHLGRSRVSIWARLVWKTLGGYITRMTDFFRRKDGLVVTKVVSVASSSTD